MKSTFFIDESGNTGTDWLNSEQPFFIYGGWLIQDKYIESVNNYIDNLLKNEQAHELKSSNILKRKNGMNICTEIIQTLIDNFYALPIFLAIDKEFMVAAKIVETFFDYTYNPNINAYLTHPTELKRALANCILNDKKILKDFLELIKKGTIDLSKLRTISKQLISLLENHNHYQVAETIRNLKDDNLKEMIKEFEYITDGGKKKTRIALTQTALRELLQNVELISQVKEQKVNVLHDKLRGYADVFKETEVIFLNQNDPCYYKNKNMIWISNFRNITSISEIDSKDSPSIQASDILCGFISKVYMKMNFMGNLGKSEKQTLKKLIFLRESYLKNDVVLWNNVTPYTFERKFILSNNPNYKGGLVNFNKIIQNEFIYALSK